MPTIPDRERALEKVRKLLSMANDGRGNVNEAESAARQAAALMQKFNIEAAEAQLADLGSDEPDLTQEFFDERYDLGAKSVPKEVPTWVGLLAVGVGRLCQVKVDGGRRPDGTTGVRFSGYSTDVVFARWLLLCLTRGVFNEARAQLGHLGKAERGAFRYAASSVLQRRLVELRAQQQAELRGSSAGTALVVVDRKAAAIAEAFGAERTRTVSRPVKHAAAFDKGRAYGQTASIPTARPVGSAQQDRRIAA